MPTYHIADYFSFNRKHKIILLAFYAFTGLLFGSLIIRHIDPSFYTLMRSVLSNSVSIVGLIVVNFLPVLITSVIALLSKPYLFFPLSFFKNFSLVVVRCLVFFSFGQAWWLIGNMISLSNVVVMPLLYWFWIRHINGIRNSAHKDIIICFAGSFVACIIEFIWVSPFLFQLLND